LALLSAATRVATPMTSPLPAPKTWIVVDAGSGAVLNQGNDREPRPPASLTKLLTALIAVEQFPPGTPIPVSARAAAEPPTKLNMQPGQVWSFGDALYALLLSSANDAAAALAERLGGTLEGFAAEMQAAGLQLGLQDNPVLEDPAGLDDDNSVLGGNLLSARDLAIIARAALAQPLLASVVATPVYEFVGPDGIHHRLGNHNELLKTYPGAIGMKTGYTAKSGADLIGAARRNGRTLIAVVLGAPSTYKDVTALLDRGFSTHQATGDVLPAVQPLTVQELSGMADPTRGQLTTRLAPGDGSDAGEVGVACLLALVAMSVGRRRRALRR
jgi:D-alanyl-D-alanine carboxypeptidase (penicillin-binding protein 5/6)